MDKALMDTIYTKIYSNGSAAHLSGWEVSVDQNDDGWYSEAHQHIDCQALHDRTPEYPKDRPFHVHLISETYHKHADVAAAYMWEWLDTNGLRLVSEFSQTGKISPGDNFSGFIPISGKATTCELI